MKYTNIISGWSDVDTLFHINKKKLLGVLTLNKLSNSEFQLKLCDYAEYIKKVKIDKKELYWKHDINNGIFTLLQLNDNLSEEKLWVVDDENHIDPDKLIDVILHP